MQAEDTVPERKMYDEYIVVREAASSIQRVVNGLIKEGFRPKGGVACEATVTGTILYQAMMRRVTVSS